VQLRAQISHIWAALALIGIEPTSAQITAGLRAFPYGGAALELAAVARLTIRMTAA
jgi:hypothetical protein